MSVLVALQGGEAHVRTTSDSLAGTSGGGLIPLLLGSGGAGGGITEGVTGQAGYVRSVAQTVGSISEAVNRVYGPVRTTADSVASISETLARIAGHNLTVADTLVGGGGGLIPLLLGGGGGVAGITESVDTVYTPGAGSFNRTAADSISAITETTSRTAGLSLAVADSVGDIAESLGEDATQIRGTADSLDVISETTERLGGFDRTTADSVGAITEAVVGVHTPSGPVDHVRTVADTVGNIVESVSHGALLIPAGSARLVILDDEPRHLERSVHDDIPFIVEFIDEEVIYSDEWLVLDAVLA